MGDTHGCSAELNQLVLTVGWRRGGNDRLFFLGDFMDRGPDPVGCVRYAREQGAEGVQGNHDEKALRFLRHEAKKLATGTLNPMGPPSAAQREQWSSLSEEDVRWLGALPLRAELKPGWLAVHGGFEGVPLDKQRNDKMLRCRYVDKVSGKMVSLPEDALKQPLGTVYWTEQWQGPESVVYGHAVHSLETPRVDRKDGFACYGIDTGCCFGGRLTAMVLHPDREPEFVQVKALSAYAKMPEFSRE